MLKNQDERSANLIAVHGQTADSVYEALKAEILAGNWREGDRITELAVAEKYSVSRTPVREALHRLVTENYLCRSAKGLTIKHLSVAEVEDLYTTRWALEGLAARLAAERASKFEIVTLTELQDRQAVALSEDRTPEVLAALNHEFHLEIVRVGRSPTVSGFMSQVYETLRRYGLATLGISDRSTIAVEEHHQLVEAIASRKVDLAEELARKHVEGALRARLAIMAGQLLDPSRRTP